MPLLLIDYMRCSRGSGLLYTGKTREGKMSSVCKRAETDSCRPYPPGSGSCQWPGRVSDLPNQGKLPGLLSRLKPPGASGLSACVWFPNCRHTAHADQEHLRRWNPPRVQCAYTSRLRVLNDWALSPFPLSMRVDAHSNAAHSAEPHGPEQ
ncbi:hypothetical protein L1887_51356 [Cichorium endivia]|nr:hypothetical protein L1887_51356 [Cichorium endivia]